MISYQSAEKSDYEQIIDAEIKESSDSYPPISDRKLSGIDWIDAKALVFGNSIL